MNTVPLFSLFWLHWGSGWQINLTTNIPVWDERLMIPCISSLRHTFAHAIFYLFDSRMSNEHAIIVTTATQSMVSVPMTVFRYTQISPIAIRLLRPHTPQDITSRFPPLLHFISCPVGWCLYHHQDISNNQSPPPECSLVCIRPFGCDGRGC